MNAAARAAARGVGAGIAFDRRARPALASSRPAGTRGGLGAGARAAEGPARPAERSAPQFGAGTRYEARRPKTAAAGAGGAETAALAAAARARARPGLASNAGEAGNDLSRASSPAVRETARPEKSVSADAFFTASSADAADVSSPAYARESPRVDVRRRDGHAEQSRENVAVADADAERLSTGRVVETESANDVAADALVSFRERDSSLNPEPGQVGTGGTTVPTTDGLAADLGVATSGASSDADVPGDLPGDVEEPIDVVPDAPSTSSLADANADANDVDAAATDPTVVPAPRPLGDTAGGADTQVPAAAQAAVTSGAREQTAGIDLGTGTGAGTGAGTETETSSPETFLPSTTTNDDVTDFPQEDGQDESSFSPPSDGSPLANENENADQGPGSGATGAANANANAAPSGTERPFSRNAFGNARGSVPYFGGGRDVGRSHAPRGFVGGSVKREPECGPKAFRSTQNTKNTKNLLDRRYIVRFRENVTDARFFELKRLVESGSELNPSKFPRLRAAAPGFRVAVLGGVTRAAKRRFRDAHADDVESVELDVEVSAFSGETGETRRDSAPRLFAALRPRSSCAALAQISLTGAQWNLDRVSPPEGAPQSEISRLDGAFAAPECLCGRGVDVYVVDTGARTSHSEFEGRVGGGFNFVDPSPSECGGDLSGGENGDGGDGDDDIMYDDSGHGTHVAGTALGVTSGVAKCATLRPVKILDGDGKGKSSSILEALDWIAAQDVASPGGRKIVSMSLGGPRSQAVDDAVAEMTEVHGVPVIVAAGNEARDAGDTSPAGGEFAIAVGSTSCYPEKDDKRCVTDVVSPFSNYGDTVAVYAPGHGVRSAWASSNDAFKENSGTSMAAPLVAGAVALYLEKYPTANPFDVKRALKTTATVVTWDGGEIEGVRFGNGGMLDLQAMLRVAPQ